MEVSSMETKHELPILGLDNCGCCETSQLAADEGGEIYGCHEKATVLTHREEQVLKSIRELALKARNIKDKIRLLEEAGPVDSEAKQRAMEELQSLRLLRSDLESERIAAAEERMRLLGHA
jgi:hypothetical protein